MIHILLSVKRHFSEKILSGEKKWELRKNVPCLKKGDSVTLWLYESGKDGARAVIGKCRMVSYVALDYMPFGDALDLLIREACVTASHIRAYLPCYVWGIQDPVRFPAAVPLSAIGLPRAPQSWQYISEEQAIILEKAASLTTKMCVECQLWSGWTGECTSSLSGHTWEEMDPEHPACDFFKLEEIEQEDDNENARFCEPRKEEG